MASSASPPPLQSTQHEPSTFPLPIRGNQYSHISADGQARQHNGNVYNTNTNYYTDGQRRSDDALREIDLNKRFLKAAAEGQTKRLKSLYGRGGNTDFVDFVDDYGMTPLHHACFGGFEDTVETLLYWGSDVNAHSELYGTSICLAALKGRLKVIDILVENRANIYADGGLLGSALHAASAGSNISTLEKLIDLGYDCNTEITRRFCFPLIEQALQGRFAETGWTSRAEGEPLHVATGANKIQTVIFLLSHGAEADSPYRFWQVGDKIECTFENADPTKRSERRTALTIAASTGFWSILQTLLQHGASPDQQDSDGNTALMKAAYRGHEQCVSSLIDAGTNMAAKTCQGDTATMLAAQLGHTEILKKLIHAGAPLDSKNNEGHSVFSIAAMYGKISCLEALILAGVHPEEREQDDTGPTALHLAAQNGHSETISFLLDKGAPLETKVLGERRSALGWAAMNGHTRCVEILIERGADVRIRDGVSRATPLHRATQSWHLGAVHALLKGGARATAVDDRGYTPLHWAFQSPRALLSPAEDTQAADDHKLTPSKALASAAFLDVIRALVESGADLDATDVDGTTPLMRATKRGDLQSVQELIKLGANLSLQNQDGKTALVIANKNGSADIAKVLDEAPRQPSKTRTRTRDPVSQISSTNKGKNGAQKTTTRKSDQSSRETNASKQRQDHQNSKAPNQGSGSRHPKRPAG